MPHSVSPDSTPTDDTSRTVSQMETTKSEPDTQDISMEDAPSPTAKPKVNLEELFDDEDSDEEFPSSAPVIKSEDESSQPAPMYFTPQWTFLRTTNSTQQDKPQVLLLRPRHNARFLPATLPIPTSLPMAQSQPRADHCFLTPRICVYPA